LASVGYDACVQTTLSGMGDDLEKVFSQERLSTGDSEKTRSEVGNLIDHL
jgi:hypothetical protein